MEEFNETLFNEFILMGITNQLWLQKVLFAFVFIFYLLDIFGNLAIISLVYRDPSLQSPMYFLLCNLSFVDLLFSTVTVPKLMYGFLMENIITIKGCITQMYFFHFLGCTEGVLLTAMGVDRYVAICHPLRYVTIMRRSTCIQMVLVSWFTGITTSLVHAIMTSQLPFCKVNRIKHFFCDVKPVIKLACKDIHVNELTLAALSGFLPLSAFLITVLSYIYIIAHVLKIKSSKGRTKIFSTCSSHLTVVILFYGTAMCTYIGPASETSIEKDKVAALLYTVITPALNPVIYTLRNKDVRNSVRKLTKRSNVFGIDQEH
ncbi:olfactory receptor 12D2-like [Bufo gargarizans]|uniref:olfactory receptor 12D2-like n=1 Tax=Bufo gargarizans TaxID=30331 RepID=UPI001CF1E6C3|nr:olfactory receptor 12D2-like [Bufo gargarizans]